MRKCASFALLFVLAGCGSSGGASSGAQGSSGATAQGNAGTSSGASTSSGAASGNQNGAAGSAATSSGGMGVGTGGAGSGASGAGNASAVGGSSATGSAGAASSSGAPLKGVAFSTTYGTCPDLTTLGLSWYYNWGSSTKCTGIEYVPQIWGDWNTLSWVPMPAKAVAGGAKYLLGFNEPDGTGQANMTVDKALELWPSFDQPGVQIGSPAVAGEGWMPDFMTGVAAKNLRVDFIAIHWYGWNAGTCNDTTALEAKIVWAEQWQRPIWLTEWSCRLQDTSVVNKFYTDALAMFAKHPLLVRYAWFLTRSASDPTDADFNDSTLLDINGAPTTLGNEYRAAPSTH
jgi:hypothetical protein